MMDLRGDKLYYLCTVYTSHPEGMVIAYMDACKLTAALLERGIKVFCPIAHGHSINKYMETAPDDHDFWMRVDKFYIEKCDELLVAMMPNWENSRGIREEIVHATNWGKPITYLDPDTLNTSKDVEDGQHA